MCVAACEIIAVLRYHGALQEDALTSSYCFSFKVSPFLVSSVHEHLLHVELVLSFFLSFSLSVCMYVRVYVVTCLAFRADIPPARACNERCRPCIFAFFKSASDSARSSLHTRRQPLQQSVYNLRKMDFLQVQMIQAVLFLSEMHT